ncbi:hypothetical protein GCM10009678_83820 [Actinomadura kijaniata]|uniref:DUF397 domain-containing protein n=1 Tax=Actinomadura namibiensis TaxID=182080 RepID=A0A7W3LVM0_ACTNM|nr:DUF397 domain-containing protein [Actinomadura namibiensis]MBA8955037.1 hypothetical protein [Actinomadura namibiensis]
MNNASPQWRKSSYSTAEIDSTCVEAAILLTEVGLRDSTDPEGPHLRVARGAFAELVGRLKERR